MEDGIFNKNEQLFFERYGYHIEKSENENFFIDHAKNGKPIICIKMGSRVLRMSSSYDPEYEADVWADQYFQKGRYLSMEIYGFGNVYYIRALLKKALKDDLFLIEEENTQFLSFIMQSFDISDIITDERLFIHTPLDKKYTMREAVGMIMNMVGDPFFLAITMRYYKESEEFLDCCRHLKSDYQVMNGFTYHMGRDAVLNSIYALSHADSNYCFSELIEKIPREMPVIIVAAGPSLLKNGALLKKFHNKAFIICVDRAAGTIHKLGVTPDMISSVDPRKPLSMLKPEDAEGSYLLFDTSANRKIQSKFQGRIFYATEGAVFAGAEAFKGKHFGCSIPGGTSVATWSAAIMADHGFKTIILVGQDMAAEGKITHSDGAMEELSNMKMVDGINGGKVPSRDDWIRFINYYEDWIVNQDNDIRLIDATEGGALIHGSSVMKLEDVLTDICTEEYDIDGIFNGMHKALDKKGSEETHKYIDELKNEAEQISDIMKRVERYASSVSKMFKYKTSTEQDIEKKLVKIDKEIKDLHDIKYIDILLESILKTRANVPTIDGRITDYDLGARELAKMSKYAAETIEGCAWLIDGIKKIENDEEI